MSICSRKRWDAVQRMLEIGAWWAGMTRVGYTAPFRNSISACSNISSMYFFTFKIKSRYRETRSILIEEAERPKAPPNQDSLLSKRDGSCVTEQRYGHNEIH